MDYTKEKETLQESMDWFKPIRGKHEVLFLSEGEPYSFEWEDKVIDKVRFIVEVNKERFQWGVTRGRTETSLYGQIVLIGANKGKLLGEKITLSVIGDKKDKKYLIDEAINLMTKKEEEKPKT